jgi:dipeptidyl aminopeptidase/acylaminoacyl peptidase
MTVDKDLRGTKTYAELERYASAWLKPGSGLVRDASQLSVSPDGRKVAFAGVTIEKLVGAPTTRICIADLDSGDVRVVSFGPDTDHFPKWSPDGKQIAFLSDRDAPGQFQPYLLDLDSGAARALPRPEGWVEYLHWRADGRALLLGVAGVGADLAGAQGGVASKRGATDLPSWMPELETGDESYRWRSLVVLDLQAGSTKPATPTGFNPWEATWLGNDAIAAIGSDSPDEAAWYSATLRVIDPVARTARELYRSKQQIGWPSAAPDAKHLAVIEAVCSDRGLVAGDLLIIDRQGAVQRCAINDVDATFMSWISSTEILYAGHESFETVVGIYDTASSRAREIWKSSTLTVGTRIYPEVAPAPARAGAFACTTVGFLEAPSLQFCNGETLRPVRSFGTPEVSAQLEDITVEPTRWHAPDGLEIHGWLLKPTGAGPLPLVLEVHGGPVWMYRPFFLGAGGQRLALLKRGYALLLPNPRGSSGRGQDYASKVFGDMGGADTHDYLSGIDDLVRRGVADPRRLGVTGGSYGGFMSAWLITQDSRFAAAVPVAPVTNWVSEHLTCHIPHFCEQFLADSLTSPGGKYHTRSPIMYASRVRTPTLLICGALDRNTPPGQALEFHHALRLQGVESVLATYPQEGHGVRSYPAVFDYGARVIGWFEKHMPARSAAG